MGTFKLLLGLVFMALVLSVGFTFIHNANAETACNPDNPICPAKPTCFCAYGGRALNHIRITTCDFEETEVGDCPSNDADGTVPVIILCNYFKPVAECNKNEEQLVVPPEIGSVEDYCYCPK